jgi:mannose-6-phosphate isomerase-like protein (cupin superfamily)
MTAQDETSAAVTPQVGTELVNPVAGSRTVFRATGASTGGAYVEVEQTYRPHSAKPPLHQHPNQDEHFTVLRGMLHAVVGDVERDVRAGEELEVPRGTPHQMWGASDEPTVLIWRTSPALRTDQMFCDLWSVAAETDFVPDLMRSYEVVLRYAEEFQLC